MKLYLPIAFLSLLLIACGGSKTLTTQTIQDGKLKKVLTFQGDSSKHKLVKEEIFAEGDRKVSELNFKNGMLNGQSANYWENGKMKDENTFVNGKKNGVFKKYDSKGRLLIAGEMKDGMKNGLWTTWYDETQKEEERSYKNDLLEGEYSYWFIDGSLKKIEFYEGGKKIKETIYQ